MNKNTRVNYVLVTLLAVVLLVSLAGCRDANDEVRLTMFVFAAPGHKDVPREVVDQYMLDHPNVVVEIIESSNAKVLPQMLAARETTPDNPPIHFGFFNLDSAMKGLLNDLWEGLDQGNIPNLNLIPEKYQQADNKGVLFAAGPYGLIYNSDLVKEPPTSYADLWSNPEFRGKVVLWDYQWAPVVMAARMNGGGESNIDPGIRAFADNVSQIHSLATSNEQIKNLLTTGDALLAFFDLQQSRVWAEDGSPIGQVIPEEGAIAWPLYLEVVKGVSPEQKRVIEDIINELLEPSVLAKFAEMTYYAPTVQSVVIPDSIKDLPAFRPGVMEDAVVLDFLEMARNSDEWSKKWDREVKVKLSGQ